MFVNAHPDNKGRTRCSRMDFCHNSDKLKDVHNIECIFFSYEPCGSWT